MKDLPSFKNHFLIAMPTMDDPQFAQSVTYLCDHNEDGAMGLIINQPIEDLAFADILSTVGLPADSFSDNLPQIYNGGPVKPQRGFVLHTPTQTNWESSIQLQKNLCVTTSKDILAAMAENTGPKHALLTLGYASWTSGQLESELAQNYWLCVPATMDIIFKTPVAARWEAAANLLGVELNQLVFTVGHA